MAFAYTHEYSPGGTLPPLQILYTNSEEAVQGWLASVASARIFGFDTENRPVFRKGQSSQLALIQLSTRSRALVVQWSHYQRAPAASPASRCLARFFCDPALSLCGMGCVSDFRQWARELQGGGEEGAGGGRHHAPRPALLELEQLRGGLDLAGAAKGLAGLCQHLIPAVLKWKSKKIQMSNWEASPLSVAQIIYAAMDGWAGLAAYEAIAAARQSAGGGAGGGAASSSSGAAGAEEASGVDAGASAGVGVGAGAGAGGSAPPPSKRQRCKFFNRPGGCRNGDSCPREHLAAAEGGSGSGGAGSGGRKVCPFFNSYSGCKKGDDCPMLHVEDED